MNVHSRNTNFYRYEDDIKFYTVCDTPNFSLALVKTHETDDFKIEFLYLKSRNVLLTIPPPLYPRHSTLVPRQELGCENILSNSLHVMNIYKKVFLQL